MDRIASTAHVSSNADLADDVIVEPGAIIEENTIIGPGCRIGPYSKIFRGTVMGRNNRIHSFSCLGSDPQTRDYDPSFPGVLKLGDNNIIHEYVTISRGTPAGGGETVLGDAHNLMRKDAEAARASR